MEDWLGVFAIVVVCMSVAILLAAILRRSGPIARTQRPDAPDESAAHEPPGHAPEEPPPDRPLSPS